MMSPYTIWIIARAEARLLRRSWAFRLFSGLGLFILFWLNFGLATTISDAPHLFRAASGSLPLMNLKLLNVYEGFIAIFLATEFIKRDRLQDTAQTVFVRSFSNLDYILGKVCGVLFVFLSLQAVVVLASGLNHRFLAPDTVFAWQPYLFYSLVLSLPTLIFVSGLAILLISIIRNQAVVLFLLLSFCMISLVVLGRKFYSYYDIFAFHVPLFYSDFIGFGNGEQLLWLRSTHLLAGIAFIALAVLCNGRLRQAFWAPVFAGLVAVVALAGASWTTATYWQDQRAITPYREQLRRLNETVVDQPVPSITSCELAVKHLESQIDVAATLSLTNANAGALDSLLFTLNPALKIQQVRIGDQEVRFRRMQHLLWLYPEEPLAAQTERQIEIHYRGHIDERSNYLDIDDKRFTQLVNLWLYSLPKKYATISSSFLHLTAENNWYPRAGLSPGAAFPAAGHQDYSRYSISIQIPRNWSAISQGQATVDSTTWTHHFQSTSVLAQVSLTAGPYERRHIRVDEIDYALYTLPGHDYFSTHFDSVASKFPTLIRDLKNEYEIALGLPYPHARLALVETPVQFFAYQRLWTTAQETVQPQIVFLPEMGLLCNGVDFRQMKRRSTRQQERANQAQSAEDIQGGYFRTFARIALLGMQDPGANMLTRTREVENRYELLPLYLSYSNHISSEQWPLLDYAFESYFREKIAPPQNTRSRQRRGLTEEERANLALQRHSLSELLNNPELEERIRATAIKAKSRYLLLHFAALLGPEKFASAFTRFTREHRFGTIADSTLFAFLAELGAAAPQDLLNSWYFTKDLPGYEIISSESYLVRDGERTRTQIKVDLRNSTDIPGLVELNFRYRQNDLTPWWDRRQSRSDFKRTIALPAQSGKNVGILLDQPTAELIIDTYIARNLPAQIHIPFTEQKFRKRASAYDGEESYALAEAEQTGEYLVDNEDAGFELVAAEETSWLRQLLIDHFDLKKNKQPYIGMRWWDPPGTWQATSDRAFYGRFVLSGHYKKAGDGRSKVAWRTEVAESGEYEIHYYYTSPGGTRGRNRRPLDKELHFRLYHDRGSEEFTLDLERAEEGWNYLGTAHLNAGPTHLELSDLSNQGYVIADAVKWQRL